MMLIGQLGAFRRSELVALDVDDVEQLEDGLRIRIRRSKTDQEGAGDWKGIPRRSDHEVCPVRALQAWLQVSGIESGPLWRPVNRHDQVLDERLTDKGVARILKRACERAGLDPARYAGHSLRSGLATAAAGGGAPERAIMAQGGWRSAKTLRDRYIRKASVFQENAANWVQV
jgi:integrase